MIFQALYRFAKSQKLLDDLDFTDTAKIKPAVARAFAEKKGGA